MGDNYIVWDDQSVWVSAPVKHEYDGDWYYGCMGSRLNCNKVTISVINSTAPWHHYRGPDRFHPFGRSEDVQEQIEVKGTEIRILRKRKKKNLKKKKKKKKKKK